MGYKHFTFYAVRLVHMLKYNLFTWYMIKFLFKLHRNYTVPSENFSLYANRLYRMDINGQASASLNDMTSTEIFRPSHPDTGELVTKAWYFHTM